MTAWVLVFLFQFDRSGPAIVIENLESLEECRRVAKVIKDSRVLSVNERTHQCIEVRKAK